MMNGVVFRRVWHLICSVYILEASPLFLLEHFCFRSLCIKAARLETWVVGAGGQML